MDMHGWDIVKPFLMLIPEPITLSFIVCEQLPGKLQA